MREDKNYEQLFAYLKPAEPPAGLFNRIIFAIKQERELRRARRLLFGFLSLLLVSLVATPLSGAMLASQMESSGISYFISAAIGDSGMFFAFWQDFSLAILESLPIAGIMAFLLSLAVAVFTLRLFIHRRRLLLSYLTRGIV